MSIRVYIVEDHPVMRETLVEFLRMDPDIQVVGAASGAGAALDGIPSADPSMVLLDLSLPDQGGLELLSIIRERWDLPCLVLTGQSDPGQVERALELGARGFLQKGRPREISRALRAVREGEVYLSESLRDQE